MRLANRARGLLLSVLSRSAVLSFLVLSLSVAGLAPPAAAQSAGSSPSPYASMASNSVAYRGPGRGTANDLRGDLTTIGVLLPLQGRQSAQGALLRAAAQLALDDELSSSADPSRPRLALVFRNESERWGQASSEIVQLIEQDHAVALITSIDGSIAHQAEQVANKIAIPILTLSSDASTTRINIPWIFRLGPSDADDSKLIAADIYQRKNLQKVLLIVANDHDARVGSQELLRAATLLHAAPPEVLDFDPATSEFAPLARQIKSKRPDAIVLWSGPEVSAGFLPALKATTPGVPLYLCRKALQFDSPADWADTSNLASSSTETTTAFSEFRKRYQDRTGVAPGPAALQIYDAVRLLAKAIRTAGPNRVRVRDFLASGSSYDGIGGPISFDPAGNLQPVAHAVRTANATRP
jgi:branched-chain amino acid transport system substrate-binding protein